MNHHKASIDRLPINDKLNVRLEQTDGNRLIYVLHKYGYNDLFKIYLEEATFYIKQKDNQGYATIPSTVTNDNYDCVTALLAN